MNIFRDNYEIILLGVLVLSLFWAYVKSPTWQDRVRLTFIIASILASAVLVYFSKISLDYITTTHTHIVYQLAGILLIATSYCSISLIFVSIAAYKKKGFNKLKEFSKNGLLEGLTWGLISGSIVGIILSLVNESLYWLCAILAGWMTIGLIFGREEEFRKDSLKHKTKRNSN